MFLKNRKVPAGKRPTGPLSLGSSRYELVWYRAVVTRALSGHYICAKWLILQEPVKTQEPSAFQSVSTLERPSSSSSASSAPANPSAKKKDQIRSASRLCDSGPGNPIFSRFQIPTSSDLSPAQLS